MSIGKDVLEQVLLTEEVSDAWKALCHSEETDARLIRYLEAGGDPEALPAEAAEVLADGRLRIHVTRPDGEVLAELLVPADGWGWMQG